MLQSPEIDLLLLCARPQVGDKAGHIRSLLRQELDWPLVFRLAEYYRTIPLLSLHTGRYAADLLASDIQEKLQSHHRNSTRHNLVLAMEVLRLVDLLSTEGVTIIPFKGPVSAMLAYGDLAMRACGDIDLLVKRNDHAKAERLLVRQGYRVEQRYQNAMQSSLRHEQRGIDIDLHWGIPPEKLQLNSGLLWGDLEPVDLLGRSVLTFSARDTLLLMAINAVKEPWKPSLHHLSDIAVLTGDYADEEWLATFRRAREIGCQRMLIAALLFTHRLLDMPLPTVGPVRLFRCQSIEAVVGELQDHLFLQSGKQSLETAFKLTRHRSVQLYYLTLTDSPWRRSRDWLYWTVTPSSDDQALITLPKWLSFLYYIVRPFRLLKKYL